MLQGDSHLYPDISYRVPNALPGRDSVELNIFGMQGVPKHLIEERILAGGMKSEYLYNLLAARYWNQIRADQASGIDKKKENPKPKKKDKTQNKKNTSEKPEETKYEDKINPQAQFTFNRISYFFNI
jgi:hypothetical protein